MNKSINQILIIKEPNPFYSQGDEDIFFYWLQKIPAVKKVTGKKGLEVTIAMPVDDYSLWELLGLFTRYGIDRENLKSFCNVNNEAWFKKKEMYWYEAVFGVKDKN